MNERSRGGFARYVLPVILFCAFIFFISSLPSPPAPSYGWKFSDKINHTGAYGIVMLLAFRASRWLFRDRSLAQQILLALIFTMLYGVSDEIHQAFVPNRECELYDWLADTLGGVLGALFIIPTHRASFLRFLYGNPVAEGGDITT
jgi:VanZ family protein